MNFSIVNINLSYKTLLKNHPLASNKNQEKRFSPLLLLIQDNKNHHHNLKLQMVINPKIKRKL